MGTLFSRFRRQPSTREQLECIEQEIQTIEDHKWSTIRKEQNYASLLFFISLLILVISIALSMYYLPLAKNWWDKILLSVPLIGVSTIIWCLKKTLQWYCRWSLDTKETRLRELRQEKRRILEQVIETEKYKVAKELLEKYDPKLLRQKENWTDRDTGETPKQNARSKIDTSLNHTWTGANISLMSAQAPDLNQTVMSAANLSLLSPKSPNLNRTVPCPANVSLSSPKMPDLNTSVIATSSIQGRPVRPILSQDRSLFDKVVDWVVNDGPSARFALICRQCHGHNGMALQEEFDSLSFRCCFCYSLNLSKRSLEQRSTDSDKVEENIEHSAKISQTEQPISKETIEQSCEKDNPQQNAQPSPPASPSNEQNGAKTKRVTRASERRPAQYVVRERS